MKSNLAAGVALRYLFSKKSHGAVTTISTVSMCAMAVATAAIICVLSVFNGFKREISSRLDSLLPDITVSARMGKTFAEADSLAEALMKTKGVEQATPVLSDNALIIFNGQEMPVTVMGVKPEEYAKVTSIRKLIRQDYGRYFEPGEYATEPTEEEDYEEEDEYGTVPSVIAIGVASRMRLYPESELLIFAPRREGRVNLANPAASFLSDSLRVNGIYVAENSQFDDDGVILPIETVRELLQYDTEASAIEIKVKDGVDVNLIAQDISRRLGDKFVVKDRLQRQEMNFRMINIEKWVSFLLLGFILLIAGFNIISSLTMLVIEKEKALESFRAMGMSRRRIGHIFAWESLFVSLTGGIAGIAIGLILCLLQQHFGLIKIGGDASATILNAYPVEVQPLDILITFIPIIGIGIITAAITASFAKSRMSKIDN